MKRVLSILILFAALSTLGRVSAQTGIAAGFLTQQHTFNYQNGILDSLSQEKAWLKGGFLGLTQSVPLIGKIGITTGVFAGYGQIKDALADTTNEFTTSSFMLKIPSLFDYEFSLGPNADVFIFVGPVFNVALSFLSDFGSVDRQADLHFDMGGTVGAGIQFYRVRLFVGYNIGLIDRDDFSLADKQSISKAWEGSSFFAGLGVSLGSRDNGM